MEREINIRDIISRTAERFNISPQHAEIFYRNDISLFGIVFPCAKSHMGHGKRIPDWFKAEYDIKYDEGKRFKTEFDDEGAKVIVYIGKMEEVVKINQYIQLLEAQRQRIKYYRRRNT